MNEEIKATIEKGISKYYEMLPQWVNREDAEKCFILECQSIIDELEFIDNQTSNWVGYIQIPHHLLQRRNNSNRTTIKIMTQEEKYELIKRIDDVEYRCAQMKLYLSETSLSLKGFLYHRKQIVRNLKLNEIINLTKQQ